MYYEFLEAFIGCSTSSFFTTLLVFDWVFFPLVLDSSFWIGFALDFELDYLAGASTDFYDLLDLLALIWVGSSSYLTSGDSIFALLCLVDLGLITSFWEDMDLDLLPVSFVDLVFVAFLEDSFITASFLTLAFVSFVFLFFYDPELAALVVAFLVDFGGILVFKTHF